MSLSEQQLHEFETKLNKIAAELIIAQPGSDEGLLPAYSLLTELAEIAQNSVLEGSVANARAAIDQLLDNGDPYDNATLDYLGNFSTWAQETLSALKRGSAVAPYPPMPKPAAKTAKKSTNTPKAEDSGPEDVLLEIDIEGDQDVLSEFQAEALDHLEQIEAALLTLESDPRDQEGLNSIFRSFHTIKGVAGFLRLIPIQTLAHQVETLLDHARNKELVLDSGMITTILNSKDAIQALVDQVTLALQNGTIPDTIIPVSHLVKEAAQACKTGKGKDTDSPATTTSAEPPPKPTAQPAPTTAKPAAAAQPAKAEKAAPAQKAKQATIRVNSDKLDNLMDTVGELVITQSQLLESAREQAMHNSSLQRNLAQLTRISKELQHTSMSLRMVPVGATFQKMGRIVRDISRNLGKQVKFHVNGEDTELDRLVVEQIGDPLVHMVRNAVDHGLEPPEERQAAGKSPEGNVHLNAFHLGSNIVIELRDDGRGIDPQKILNKAREKQLVSETQEFSTHEILQFIFMPGFSTAEKVTDVSGRGVGMDVVRQNIESLRGKVEIQSELGKGSIFSIKLPLTTAIIDGLLVRVGEDKFILPTLSVKVAMRPEPEHLSTIKGRGEMLDLRDTHIPITRLHNCFNIPNAINELTKGILVVVETMGRPYALLVDEMISKQEVVIKNLGNAMRNIPGIAGGAILGDGTIALILDPASLPAHG